MIDHNNRTCKFIGCNTLGQHLGKYNKDGTIRRRSLCSNHHYIYTAAKKGLNKNQWKNSFHKYKKYRKEYCENIDGRLGFKCTATIVNPYWQLDADHINGNPTNNEEANIQTLCSNCHRMKTMISADGKSPGRKTLYAA